MTPFGIKLRQLRHHKGVTQKQMAAEIGVSPAYLSALERGHRGMPGWDFLQRVIGYFNVIWDDAEELQILASHSKPRVMVDTQYLSASATSLANLLAREIDNLDEADCQDLMDEIINLTTKSS